MLSDGLCRETRSVRTCTMMAMRNLSVLMVTVLGVSTFGFIFVLQVHRTISSSMLLDQHRTSNFQFHHIGDTNSVKFLSYEVLNWKRLPDMHSKGSYNTSFNRSPKSFYKNKSRDILFFQPKESNKTSQVIPIYISSSSYKHKSKFFRVKLFKKAAQLLKETIRVFDLVMTANQINYTIYGGTLIGSYRHHGFVPWDDDIDVLVPLSARTEMYHALTNTSPEYLLSNDMQHSWKFFSVLSEPIHGCKWSWPYLDIFFYAENETHIWDTSPQYKHKFVYSKTIMFPFRRRPFLDLLLLAPHNPMEVINTNYDITLCQTGAWIHKWERLGTETTLPCSALYSMFPFVRRTFINNGCNETLVKNRDVINIFFDNKFKC